MPMNRLPWHAVSLLPGSKTHIKGDAHKQL
jgi:hypothetical protein